MAQALTVGEMAEPSGVATSALRYYEELARLPDDRVPERADWDRLSQAWRARIDGRIAELERLRGPALLAGRSPPGDGPGRWRSLPLGVDRAPVRGQGIRFEIRS